MSEALNRRFAYGDIAEDAFKKFCKYHKITCVQFGITKLEDGSRIQPEVGFKIPAIIKCSPDFWIVKNEFNFVECKMADKKSGSHFKIKEKDLKYYKQWANIASLLFYIHNPMHDESYFLKLEDIENIIITGNCKEGIYPENNKKFYEIDMDDVRMYGKKA